MIQATVWLDLKGLMHTGKKIDLERLHTVWFHFIRFSKWQKYRDRDQWLMGQRLGVWRVWLGKGGTDAKRQHEGALLWWCLNSSVFWLLWWLHKSIHVIKLQRTICTYTQMNIGLKNGDNSKVYSLINSNMLIWISFWYFDIVLYHYILSYNCDVIL